MITIFTALPDSLLIPEESTPRYYAYTAPFKTFIFHGDLGTDPTIYNYYPKAFSANLVNDVDPGQLAKYRPQLTQSIRNGDILMAHADYWQANNSTLVQMYLDAGASGSAPPPAAPPAPAPSPAPPVIPPPAPAPNPPSSNPVVITAPTATSVISGNIVVQAQVSVALDAAGSYLMVDGAEVGTNRLQGPQFNFALDTTTLANGTHTLQVWAHDVTNSTDLSTPVSVTVANAPAPVVPPAPVPSPPATGNTPWAGYPIGLTYPSPAQTVSGTIAVSGLIAQTLDAAGSYLTVDGAEWGTGRIDSQPYLYQLDTTALTAGAHTLQLWAHDINNNTLLSNLVTVFVAH